MISFLDPEEQVPDAYPKGYLKEFFQKYGVPTETKLQSLDFSEKGFDKAFTDKFGYAPPKLPSLQPFLDEAHKHNLNFTTQKIQEALIARFGEMPSLQEIAQHCHCFFDTQNVAHYVWLDEPPKLGDKIDPASVLCVIAPPKFGPFGEP